MYFRSPKKPSVFARLMARRAIALLVLLSVLLSAVPIPLGWKAKPRSGTQAFPCQNCHCGCATPEQCWTNCCCFTPAERQAWAIENGVEPPSYAVLAELPDTASESAIDTRLTSKTCGSGGPCCTSGASCCSTSDSAQSKPSCCVAAKPACPNCKSAEATEVAEAVVSSGQAGSGQAAQSTPEAVLVLSLMSNQCRGGSSEFTLLPWAIVADCELQCFFPEPIVASYEVHDEWFPSLASAPDVPPPRS